VGRSHAWVEDFVREYLVRVPLVVLGLFLPAVTVEAMLQTGAPYFRSRRTNPRSWMRLGALRAGDANPRWVGWAAAGAVAAYSLYRYREALFMFYFYDDFWVMQNAATVRLDSPVDLLQFFQPGHAGFALYRPLSTVAYSFLLQSLVGYDASAQHAIQLLIFAANVALAFAISQRVTHSVVASTAAALLYTIAPGQALNAYWLSAFTVTGTAFWLLLMMAFWLYAAPARRPVLCALAQLAALLSSEHGVEGPGLLLVLAAMRREVPRRVLAAIAPSALLVMGYLAMKLYYFVILRPASAVIALGTYSLTLDVTIWLEHLGQYLVQCSTPLALWEPSDRTALLLACGLLGGFALACRPAYRKGGAWSLVAGGIAFFIVALAAVFPQRARFGTPYICVAVLGVAWAAIGLFELTGRHGRWLALAFALAMVVLDGASDQQAWRSPSAWRLILNGSFGSARWMETVRRAALAGNNDILVPRDAITQTLFRMGRVQTFFPEMPERVTLHGPHHARRARPGQIVLTKPVPLTAPSQFPGAQRRWDWLRRLAGPDSGTIRLGANHEYPVQMDRTR
jgi:hypothetical protein